MTNIVDIGEKINNLNIIIQYIESIKSSLDYINNNKKEVCEVDSISLENYINNTKNFSMTINDMLHFYRRK